MNIKITVMNHFTRENIVDTLMENCTSSWEDVEKAHNIMSRVYPDCYVNFVDEENHNFICAMPYNQRQDEEAYDKGLMTFDQFCAKWYKGAHSNCNEEDYDGISDEEIERQVDMLLEQDWAERDSICY